MQQQHASYYHAFTKIEEQDCRLTVPDFHMPTFLQSGVTS